MKLLLPLFCFLLLFSCKKSDSGTVPVEKTTLSVATAPVTPGDALVIKSDKKVIASEVNILFNGTSIKGYAMKDSAYVFFVPVVAPGKVIVSIPGIEGSNTLEVTVKDYTVITEPQTVINDFVDKRNKSIDSITKVVAGSNFQPSAESITLLNQLKEEWNLQMSKLSAADKNLLAYVLQKNNIDPGAFSFVALPPGSFARVQSDAGDKLVSLAKEHVTAINICVGSIPFLVASTTAFLSAPNPVTGAIFLGVFTTFIISREAAIRKAKEVGALKGVGDGITESNTFRITATEFMNGSEKEVTMSVNFRNLTAADANIQADIAASFNMENTYLAKDQEIETLYGKVTSKTEKLKGSYPSYSKIIGNRPSGKSDVLIEGARIEVKGVSDPRISFTSSLSNSARKVKITSTATTEFNFDLQVSYKRSLDGKEFTKTIPCTYKPAAAFELTGLWKLNHYEDGSRASLYQTDLIDFGTGAAVKGIPIWYDIYPNGKGPQDAERSDVNTWNQAFYPATNKLHLTHNYWRNITYRFDYNSNSPNRLLGESLGASNKGFNLELVKQ